MFLTLMGKLIFMFDKTLSVIKAKQRCYHGVTRMYGIHVIH